MEGFHWIQHHGPIGRDTDSPARGPLLLWTITRLQRRASLPVPRRPSSRRTRVPLHLSATICQGRWEPRSDGRSCAAEPKDRAAIENGQPPAAPRASRSSAPFFMASPARTPVSATLRPWLMPWRSLNRSAPTFAFVHVPATSRSSKDCQVHQVDVCQRAETRIWTMVLLPREHLRGEAGRWHCAPRCRRRSKLTRPREKQANQVVWRWRVLFDLLFLSVENSEQTLCALE